MSQFGEDHIIRKIFLKLPVINHYCVEFGAWDGIKHSNTVNLIKRYDWKGTSGKESLETEKKV